MKKTLFVATMSLFVIGMRPFWGFFAHEKINQLAVFTLPSGMIGFYKKNIGYIRVSAVNPDKRRYAVADEAPRHYLDLDHYGSRPLPADWFEAVALYSEDTLNAHGILPWHIYRMYHRLRDAFLVKDPALILRLSAEMGHYIADAHVPLHTTKNYNGQLTGQEGIHGFWESRLPELFAAHYDFFVGGAEYIPDIRSAVWEVVQSAHRKVNDVLDEERKLSALYQEKKYSYETRGKVTVKVYAIEYARGYHRSLRGMVEQQMRASVKMVGDCWYTAWVDAGQPDLGLLIDYKPSEVEMQQNREALRQWRERRYAVRDHE